MRSSAARAATYPSSDLHDALVAANESARLAAAAARHGCAPEELAGPDGRTLDMTRLFEFMRKRGYYVGTPVRPQQQLMLKRGLVTWTVDIGVGGINGTKATMMFYTRSAK